MFGIYEPWVWYVLIYVSIGLAVGFAVFISRTDEIQKANNVTFWKAVMILFVKSLPVVKMVFVALFDILAWPLWVASFILWLEDGAKDWARQFKDEITNDETDE